MYIVAIAWIYVVFMMSITEESVVAGVMTFVLYGILPLTIILYIMGTPQRKRRKAALAAAAAEATENGQDLQRDLPPDLPHHLAHESPNVSTTPGTGTDAATATGSTGSVDDARKPSDS